ncbi:ATP-dependent endonuclease [Janibacter sp. FSL W8-0316]|uniref:ATP-dependent endonuclease n=1 Tax=Janibacter sp. FSL W8-0316 TaxID=2975325 RepID=UPI0030FA292E
MGGITNLRSHALRDGPHGRGLALAGLYDVPEEHHVRRGLLAAGVLVTGGVGSADIELAEVGFHACDRDLEDELLRAVGPDGAQAVIEAAGEATSLRLLAQMPSQRGWTREEVLRRFLTSQSGRKARYASLLVEALDLDRAPKPLVAVLEDAVGR